MKTVRRPAFISTQVSESCCYYLNLAPRAGGEITVVCGGRERCAPDYVIDRRDFRFFAVEYVAEGEGSLVLDGKPHVLRPMCLFTYGPGVPHTIRTSPRKPMLKYFIDFVGGEGEACLREGPPGLGQMAMVAAHNELIEIFESLYREGARNTRLTPAICATLLRLLFLKVAESVIPPTARGTRAFQTYRRCREFIEAHYLALSTLGQIAAQTRVNASYLCRLFQQFGHGSPYQYLLRQKMQHAVNRLHGSRTLIKEVAAEVGFADPYHFSRTFKKVYGLSPEHFLKFAARGSRAGIPAFAESPES
ncbi:MAG: helix-turn-helix transcriptional regulator [Kiritimatiellae bacterium]|nr:helix-turn-helix transcriptional regulator [Kiritimatiellia bacterium]